MLFACGCSGSGSHAAKPTCATEIRAIARVTDKGTGAAKGTHVTVDAANAAFAPTCITGVPHGVVTLSVRNTGAVVHNVEIAAQQIDVDVAPRDSVAVRLRVGDDPVVYVCRIHRALGMVGVLIPTTG